MPLWEKERLVLNRVLLAMVVVRHHPIPLRFSLFPSMIVGMGPRITGFLLGATIASAATQFMVHYDILCRCDAIDEHISKMNEKSNEMKQRIRGVRTLLGAIPGA